MGTRRYEFPSQSKVTSIALSPDIPRILAVENSGLREWKTRRQGTVGVSPPPIRVDGGISTVAISTDGQWTVTGDAKGIVTVWNARTHGRVFQIMEHKDLVFAIDVSNDSKWLASASRDKTVRIFSIISGTRVTPPLQHTHSIAGIQFSPDGSRIATVSEDSRVGVYDVLSALKLFEIKLKTHIPVAPSVSVTPLAWSSSGQQLFIASPNRITCFDTSTSSQTQWSLENEEDVNVSIISGGNFIVCSAGSSVSFWDSTSHKQISRTIDHPYPIHCITTSHDRKHLACGHDWGVAIHVLSDYLPQSYLQTPVSSPVPLIQVSDAVLRSWMPDGLKATEAILSGEIAQRSDRSHDVFAIRALIRAHLGERSTAMEDAEKSLQIAPSSIGQIAKCIALVSAGERDAALDHFDFAFRDGDPSDSEFLLAVKSILMFVCGKHKQAVSRLQGLINGADEWTKGVYLQILGNIYCEQGDYENAVQTLSPGKYPSISPECGPLVAVSLIFNWNLKNLYLTAWRRVCEKMYTVGSAKDVGETLLKIVGTLAEDKQEATHCRILQEIVTRSGDVTLLAWTGKPSTCNSCLPSSPTAYKQDLSALTPLEGEELRKRAAKLRAIFPLEDALVMYGRVSRLQPVRFVHFRLLLPCIVFRVESLAKEENVYHAGTGSLGNVEFTTAESLPLDEPHKLVFANMWVRKACDDVVTQRDKAQSSDVEANRTDAAENETDAAADPDLVHISFSEEVPTTPPPSDQYSMALQLIAQLGQPFSALLLLRQADGTYKRVAADHEIIVRGAGNNVPKDICVEVLEVV